MADAARPAPILETAPARRRNPLVWVVAAVVALAGIGLIAHGAVRGLTEAFGRPAANPPVTAAPHSAAVARDAPVTIGPEAGSPAVGAESSPAPSTLDAPASEAAPAIEPPSLIRAPIPAPSMPPAAVAASVVAAPIHASALREASAPPPTAGPARSVAPVPVARPVAHAPVARPIAPAWAEPASRAPLPRRRVRRDDGVWVEDDEPPAYVDDGARRPRVPGLHSRRPWLDDPEPPRRADYPRSANPY